MDIDEKIFTAYAKKAVGLGDCDYMLNHPLWLVYDAVKSLKEELEGNYLGACFDGHDDNPHVSLFVRKNVTIKNSRVRCHALSDVDSWYVNDRRKTLEQPLPKGI
jgi:hypothetical protein